MKKLLGMLSWSLVLQAVMIVTSLVLAGGGDSDWG